MDSPSSREIDMLHGTIMNKILFFAIPLAAGSILQQLFHAVDVAVVGQFASSQALAAVGSNAPVVTLLINLFVGISIGSNVVIANFIGRNALDRVKHAVHTSMLIGLLCGIFLCILGIFSARFLLTLMSTPDDVLKLAIRYLQIYCCGMPFIMLYNFGASILRSIGDTRRPLIALILSGIVNAILNMIFVICFHMSVTGVALATVISNVISCGLILYFLMREESIIHLSLKEIRIHRQEFQKILQIGLPAGLQGMVFSFANVCIQTAINGYGSSVVAGSAVALNFEYLTYYAINGFNSAVVTFTSQNYGAHKYDRCSRIYRNGLFCAVIACILLNLVFYMGRDIFIQFFTSDPEVIRYTALRMKLVLLPQFIACSYEISGSALRGLGKSMTPAVLTVFGTCIIRLIWINTVNVRYHSFALLMAVYPFTWVITGTMVVVAYLIIRKKQYQ